MGLVFEHGGGAGQAVICDQIFPDDDNDHTGRADVLLHAAVDHAILRHIHRLGQKARGHIGNQRLSLGIG